MAFLIEPKSTCNNIMDKDKEKSAVADFLGEFGNKGDSKDPFNDAPKDPFAKEEVAVETPVEEPKEKKPLPFNKDPKIQKYLDKREKEIEERLSSKFGDRKETIQAPDTRMEEVLTRIIGNDTPERVQGIKDMKELLTGLTGKAKAEAIAELESRQNAEVEADREAEQELETAFDNIEENFDVDISSNNPIAKKTRQEFVAFVEKIAPKDRNGDIVDYPDMNSAWEMFDERRKSTATPSRAKELASRSMARSAETGSQQAIPVNKHSFERTDNFIESLSK